MLSAPFQLFNSRNPFVRMTDQNNCLTMLLPKCERSSNESYCYLAIADVMLINPSNSGSWINCDSSV